MDIPPPSVSSTRSRSIEDARASTHLPYEFPLDASRTQRVEWQSKQVIKKVSTRHPVLFTEVMLHRCLFEIAIKLDISTQKLGRSDRGSARRVKNEYSAIAHQHIELQAYLCSRQHYFARYKYEEDDFRGDHAVNESRKQLGFVLCKWIRHTIHL
jgi:hypothetical protein